MKLREYSRWEHPVREAALAWIKTLTLGSDTARALLMLLADFIDEALYCEISQEELAELLGTSKRTVQRWTAWLEQMNFIRRIQRFNHLGRPLPDGYFLCLESSENETRRQPGDDEPSTRRQPGDTQNGGDTKYLDLYINKKKDFPTLNFPANVTQDLFWLWVDTRTNSGHPLSFGQMQFVLEKLAAVEQYESATVVLEYLIQANAPGVNLQYWQERSVLRTKKDSAGGVKKGTSKPATKQAPPAQKLSPEELEKRWQELLTSEQMTEVEAFESRAWKSFLDDLPDELKAFVVERYSQHYQNRKANTSAKPPPRRDFSSMSDEEFEKYLRNPAYAGEGVKENLRQMREQQLANAKRNELAKQALASKEES